MGTLNESKMDSIVKPIALKIPAFCLACGKIMAPVDTKHYEEWGSCGDCYIEFIEGREKNFLRGQDNSVLIKLMMERRKDWAKKSKEELAEKK